MDIFSPIHENQEHLFCKKLNYTTSKKVRYIDNNFTNCGFGESFDRDMIIWWYQNFEYRKDIH